MKTDKYGEVINHKETYQDIADYLRYKAKGKVLIGWTDECGTHFDILFVKDPFIEGNMQGGIKEVYLFVSIMRIGASGFVINDEDTHPGYIGEKLNLGNNITTEKVAELINGVRKEFGEWKFW